MSDQSIGPSSRDGGGWAMGQQAEAEFGGAGEGLGDGDGEGRVVRG